jgi:hypothetical protein
LFADLPSLLSHSRLCTCDDSNIILSATIQQRQRLVSSLENTGMIFANMLERFQEGRYVNISKREYNHHPQRHDRKVGAKVRVQGRAYGPAPEGVEHDGGEGERPAICTLGDVGAPELLDPAQLRVARQIGHDAPAMAASAQGGRRLAQEIILTRHASGLPGPLPWLVVPDCTMLPGRWRNRSRH